MTVYILTSTFEHTPPYFMGVFSTAKKAKDRIPGRWRGGPEMWVLQTDYYIYRIEKYVVDEAQP